MSGYESDVQLVLLSLAVIVGLFAALCLLGLLIRAVTLPLRRRLIERIVVGQIAAVVRQNLPLPTALALAARGESGWAGIALQRASKLLAQGATLAEAMRLACPQCSSLVLSLVEAGEKAGQLPAALDQAEQYLVQAARHKEREDVYAGIYAVCMISCTALMVTGVMIAVVPKFKEIFADYGTTLPGLTLRLIAVSEWFVTGMPPGWIVAAVPVVPVLYLCLRRRRYPNPRLATRVADWIRWHTPGLRRMECGRATALMLGTIRMAVQSGMDLAGAARLAAELDVNHCLRVRVRGFADLLARGTGLAQASEAARLDGVTTIALLSGQRTSDMDAALRYATDYHEALVSRWWVTVRHLAWPVTTLALATVVGTLVVSLFMPIITLINCVSNG